EDKESVYSLDLPFPVNLNKLTINGELIQIVGLPRQRLHHDFAGGTQLAQGFHQCRVGTPRRADSLGERGRRKAGRQFAQIHAEACCRPFSSKYTTYSVVPAALDQRIVPALRVN